MNAAVLLLWAGCAKPPDVEGPVQAPADGKLASGCVVPSPTAEGEPVYPLVVHPIDRSRAVWQEARFRYETGWPWSWVQIRSDGLVGQATVAGVPAASDEQLRALARQAELLGLTDPSAAEGCEIQDQAGGVRSLHVVQTFGGQVIGELRIEWVQPHGLLTVKSSLVPGLTEPPPDQLSDEELTARTLERLGDEKWQVWAEPEPLSPCDCAARNCRVCREYARGHAERYFEPFRAPVRLTPGHFRWDRAFVRLLTPEGTEALRCVAISRLHPLPSEVPARALGVAQIGLEGASRGEIVMVDAVTGEELAGEILSYRGCPAP